MAGAWGCRIAGGGGQPGGRLGARSCERSSRAAHVGWRRLRAGRLRRWCARPQCWPRGPRAPSTSRGARTAAASRGRPRASTSAAAPRWACRSTTRPTRPAPTTPGLALFRYAGHVDVDLIGRRLSIPIDINMFTDRLAIGFARKFVPSELDVITGVTSTWRLGPGALEGGARFELDATLDHGGYDAPPASARRSTATCARATSTRWPRSRPASARRCAAATCAAG